MYISIFISPDVIILDIVDGLISVKPLYPVYTSLNVRLSV
nr:MAG TPA: hypothetical protein [Crassvirales sp.]